MKKFSICVVFATLFVALFVFAATAEAGKLVTKSAETTVSVEKTYTRAPVRARVFWGVPVVAAPARAVVAVEKAEAPTCRVVESPKDPFVVRGIFTDRVRLPRGRNLTVECQ